VSTFQAISKGIMNPDVVESLWRLLHSDGSEVQQFAERAPLTDEAVCGNIVSLVGKVIKAEGEPPQAKLCALQVSARQTLHACMMRRSVTFAVETARKLLGKLVALARFRKESRDSNRGLGLFSASSREGQLASAEFLQVLLQAVQAWGLLYLSETDSTLASFYTTYQMLVSEGVAFPDSGEVQRPGFDLEQFQSAVSRLEMMVSSGLLGSDVDLLAADVRVKSEALQAILSRMQGRASETTTSHYSNIQKTATSTLDRYETSKSSARFFASPAKQSVALEWDAEPFPDEVLHPAKQPLQPAKKNMEMEFGFDDIEDEFPKPPSKKAADFDFGPKWETGDFFTQEFATAPVQLAVPIVVEREGKRREGGIGGERERLELTEIVDKQVAKIAEQTTNIAVLQGELQKLNKIVKEKDGLISAKEEEIASLKADLAEQRAEIAKLGDLADRDREQIDNFSRKMTEMSKSHQLERQQFEDQLSKQEKEVLFPQLQAIISNLTQEIEALHALNAKPAPQVSASISTFDDYFPETHVNALPDLRAQNPFEEKSFVDDIIAEVQASPTDFQEINDSWYKSALTKPQGLLFESQHMAIAFVVTIQRPNVALVKVTITAKGSITVRTAEAVDNVVGTVRVETGSL